MFAAARSLGRASMLKPSFVRHGSGRGHAEFEPDVVNKFYRMTAEATAAGLFFAFWWRHTHNQEKARYDQYYNSLKHANDD
mmetsp:Transcript_30781/g.78566  ORF Transcript_30781/g.78566 Transcript_30781/m.78566 type:complete len:81 (+) Transcript_30781:55-297(+)|eukprot:CAMPEP_0118829058 /NCGR_PEP_ID=MMETSP1162-20130426/21011_1 /TAXON_ID=33656 /ORGANISM="Phaeocystis Sp, Strain CCMP2710" /LENGTH=80 /DNA_ID=CAMNT_0006760157 /DNA_START=39 /DNA_END=281 /DNA_ORIENTATION=-